MKIVRIGLLWVVLGMMAGLGALVCLCSDFISWILNSGGRIGNKRT